MFMKRGLCFLAITMLAILWLSPPAGAAAPPEVVWTRDVYGVDKDDEATIIEHKKGNWNLLIDNAKGRDMIADAIFEVLKSQESQGKLPFRLKDVSHEKNADRGNVDSPIAIVPIVVSAADFHTEYELKDSSLHEYILVSALDIAFCSVDSDGLTLRLLGSIPLHFYTEIPESQKVEDMKLLSRAQEQDFYNRYTVEMIKRHLDFSRVKKLMKHIEDKTEASETTYQVTDVAISSKKATELFQGVDGLRAKYLKKMIADVYTSAYAQRTGNVIYPSLSSGKWTWDAVKRTYALQLNTGHSGDNKTLVMQKPDNEIKLDVTGVANQEIETKKKSDVNGFMLYKVWLKKSPAEGKETLEASPSTTKEFIRSDENGINQEDQDIYRMLLIDAAYQLGAQKFK